MGLGGDLALGFQPCQRDAGLSELGGGNAFSFAQGIESFTGLNALAFPHRVFACLFLNRAAGFVQLRAGRVAGEFGLMPAQVRDQRVEGVDLFRQALVFAGLGGLALEAGELALDFSGDFRQALQIGLGAVQLQFGFVTAGIEACNAGGFLKDTAAVLRLGADQFRNLTLAYESRGVRAGRSIREQELDVLAAYSPAIQLVGGACAALQAADDFQCVGGVEFRWRGAFGIVQHERDFSGLAGGAAIRTGEDEVIHLPAAHGTCRACAHGPAKGFQKIGLATAIRPDDPGQAGFDWHVLRVHKGFEASNTEFGYLHTGSPISLLVCGDAGSFKRSVQRGCDLVSGVHVGELVHFTIDNEGWCAGDAELFGCLVDVRHLLAQVAIVHAGIEVGLGLDAMTLANGLEHGLQDAVLRRFNDAGLVFEQLVQHVEILVFARAHGDEVGRHIRCVQWVFAEDEFHLAGVDIVRLDNWLDVVMPVFAGRAGG